MTEKPQQYTFEDIQLQQKVQFSVKITKAMVADFAKISGDYNPLHTDKNYAAKTNFKKPVVHGMLLASFFSRLVGMHLPGKNALYLSQTLNFEAPCFVGDQITIVGKVIDKSQSTRIISLETIAYNQNGSVLASGVAKVIIRDGHK